MKGKKKEQLPPSPTPLTEKPLDGPGASPPPFRLPKAPSPAKLSSRAERTPLSCKTSLSVVEQEGEEQQHLIGPTLSIPRTDSGERFMLGFPVIPNEVVDYFTEDSSRESRRRGSDSWFLSDDEDSYFSPKFTSESARKPTVGGPKSSDKGGQCNDQKDIKEIENDEQKCTPECTGKLTVDGPKSSHKDTSALERDKGVGDKDTDSPWDSESTSESARKLTVGGPESSDKGGQCNDQKDIKEINNDKQKLDNEKKKVEELENHLDEERKRNNELQKECNGIKKLYKRTKKKLEESEKFSSSLKRKLDNEKKNVEELENHLDEERKRNNELQKECNGIKKLYKRTKKNLEESEKFSSSLKRKINMLFQQLEVKSAKITDLQFQICDLREEILKEKVKGLEKRNIELQDQVALQGQELEKYKNLLLEELRIRKTLESKLKS